MNRSFCLLFLILVGSNNLLAQAYERYRKLLDTTVSSTNLGFDKNITITVPFEWQEDIDREFPLIIVFDQQNQRSYRYILNTIDYLTSNEQMPSSVIIGVESVQSQRYYETIYAVSDEQGLALQNERFIFEELIPLAENKYKASSFRLLIGHSRYGYFTTSLLCSRINDLNGVISISPFFGQKNINLIDSISLLENQLLNSHKYYRYGTGNDYPADFYKMDSLLKQFNNPRLDFKGRLFKEADHNVTPGLTVGTALYEIFEDWSEVQSKYISNEQSDLTTIDTLRKCVQAKYGSQLKFSLGILNGKGWFFYNEKEYVKAIQAWEILMETYPNFSEGYLYIIDAQLHLKQNYDDVRVKFHQSLANSEIYSEKEKIELNQELENMIQ